jgi:hypothetical protein
MLDYNFQYYVVLNITIIYCFFCSRVQHIKMASQRRKKLSSRAWKKNCKLSHTWVTENEWQKLREGERIVRLGTTYNYGCGFTIDEYCWRRNVKSMVHILMLPIILRYHMLLADEKRLHRALTGKLLNGIPKNIAHSHKLKEEGEKEDDMKAYCISLSDLVKTAFSECKLMNTEQITKRILPNHVDACMDAITIRAMKAYMYRHQLVVNYTKGWYDGGEIYRYEYGSVNCTTIYGAEEEDKAPHIGMDRMDELITLAKDLEVGVMLTII